MMLGSVGVVIGVGLPDACDPGTLTDFADLRTARVAT